MRPRAVFFALALALPIAAVVPAPTIQAAAVTVPAITNMSYKPEPAISAIPPQPDPSAIPKHNPTGHFNAYDLNAYETIWFPHRQAGDESAKDAPGGAIQHGTCPDGGCANHGLEFIRFWRKTMRSIVAPFGGVVRRYKFFSPGSEALPTPPGDTFNLQAIIPGTTNPDHSVIVSGHYDMTDSGPASAWDSAEGHATVIRIAKILTDYWKKTGTRPTSTVRFGAWAAEEAGTFGSEAYIRNQVTPFPSTRVRGYFNLDPCGGAYPAYYRGNPADRVAMVMHLANPANAISPEVKADMEDFNKQARVILGDVFNHLDDNLTDVPTEPEIFVSDEEAEKAGIPSQEPEVVEAVGGLAFFSSDYGNFEDIGVPILNLFPDMFGPHANRSHTGYRNDGIATIHTPNDNLKTLNALTGVDQSGLTPSQGWYKGLELCAHIPGWFMLQPNMGGASPVTTKPVAFFEAKVPDNADDHNAAPIQAGKPLLFKAYGSHAWTTSAGAQIFPRTKLAYRWNFGDGSTARGIKPNHTFKKDGLYKVTLTVKAPTGSDTISMLVKVGA